MSKKKKLNTKSSTEFELIGVDDTLFPACLWMQYFMESQGYEISKTVMYQDNKSAILLEENWKSSSRRQTKHIQVCYFFINDRIGIGDVSMKYCPTEDMLGDQFTKTLQGELFRKF